MNANVRLIMNLEEGVSVEDAINEMEYIFNLDLDHGDMVDTEITNFEVEDSK